MPLRLVPLLPADVPRCVNIYFAAFQDPHAVSRWPRSVPLDRKWWESAFTIELSQPGAHWLKVVAVDEVEGDEGSSIGNGSSIAAFAKWQEYPSDQNIPQTITSPPTWPSGADAATCDETVAAWTRAHSETMGARAHWHLEFFATDPAYQGSSGDGSDLAAQQQLIQWGLERADVAGVDVYVKAAPEAVLLYGRFGFWEMGRREKWVVKDGSAEGEGEGEWLRDVYMLRYAAGCCA